MNIIFQAFVFWYPTWPNGSFQTGSISYTGFTLNHDVCLHTLRFGDLEQPPWQQWHSNLAPLICIGSMHGTFISIYPKKATKCKYISYAIHGSCGICSLVWGVPNISFRAENSQAFGSPWRLLEHDYTHYRWRLDESMPIKHDLYTKGISFQTMLFFCGIRIYVKNWGGYDSF